MKFHPSFSGKRDSGENLKKVLALVLAFACAVTMFAGAAFTDSADIKVDTEVVDTLVSLGVVNGYDDGSFKPNGTVTRAEMAKMIYVLRTGNSDASAYNDDKTSFTDIGSHWARGYIKYCKSLGIIAGKSNTKFAPNDKVTAQEAAKMLLVTLGYNADKAGLVGTGWASKTNALADENGLLEDVNTSFTSACPRQYAAQLIYNTIFAHTVTLRDGEYTNMNLLGTDKLETVGEKYMGLKKWIGTYNGNADSLGIDDGQIQVEGTLDGKDYDENNKEIKPIAANFKGSLDLKYVGEEVSVLFKDVTGGTTNQPDKKDNIYGVYVTGTTKVINATLDDVDDKTDGKKIKVDGTKYEVAALDEGDEYVVNNLGAAKALTVPKASANDAEKSAKLFAALGTQSGAPIKFVCNDNGKIVKAYVTTSTINKVNATTSSKVTLNSIGGLEKEDNYIYDGAKKDDIVVATKQFSDAKYTVTKAETVTGVLKGFTKDGSAFTKVNIDGTVYKIDNKKLNKLNDDCVDKIEDSDIDSQVTAYLINGMVGALEVEEGSSNWAVVNSNNGKDNLETSFNSAEVELITADGKTISGKVHKDSESAKGTDLTNPSTTLVKGTLVKYVQTSDSVIKIKEVHADPITINADKIIYNKDTKSLSTNADATTFMVVSSDAPAYIPNSDGDIKVYKLRDLKTITAKDATKVNYVVDDSKVIAAYIELNARPTGSTADTVYGEVTSANGTKKVDGDYYSEYVVTCNDTPYTVYTNQSLKKKQIVSFDPTSDKIYDANDIKVYGENMDAKVAKAVYVKEYDEGETLTYYTKVTLNDKVYTGADADLVTQAVDDDVVVAYVDLDDTDKAGENIGVNEFSATTGYANAVVVYDTDGKTIVAIFVETSDEVNMATVVTNK